MTAEEIFSKKFKEAVIENEYLPAFSREEIINLLNEFARIKCEEMKNNMLKAHYGRDTNPPIKLTDSFIVEFPLPKDLQE